MSRATHEKVVDPQQAEPLSPRQPHNLALRCPLDTKSIDDLNARVLAALTEHATSDNGKIYQTWTPTTVLRKRKRRAWEKADEDTTIKGTNLLTRRNVEMNARVEWHKHKVATLGQ